MSSSTIFCTKTWEQRKLGEIITEHKETVDSNCTLPILTSSKTEGVILQEEHFGRKQQHDITGYNILPRNYCTYRNRSDGVDFTFNINKCCDKGIISKFYPVFRGKNSDVFFLSLVLNNSDEVVHEIAYTCTGTGQKVLSFLDLQKMKVRVPSFEEQKEVATYFESLDHLITLHQHKLFPVCYKVLYLHSPKFSLKSCFSTLYQPFALPVPSPSHEVHGKLSLKNLPGSSSQPLNSVYYKTIDNTHKTPQSNLA